MDWNQNYCFIVVGQEKDQMWDAPKWVASAMNQQMEIIDRSTVAEVQKSEEFHLSTSGVPFVEPGLSLLL